MASATATVPAKVRTPPETIDARTLVSEATTPASKFPSSGAPATCASSMPESLPRIESGVTVSRMFERRTALMKSAAPAAARKISANHAASAKPTKAIATPQAPAATDAEALAPHGHHPARRERRQQRAGERRSVEEAQQARAASQPLGEGGKQGSGHAEDHR